MSKRSELKQDRSNSLADNISTQTAWWFSLFAGMWFVVALVLLIFSLFSDRMSFPWWSKLYLAATVIFSPVAFVMYWRDKQKAEKDLWRTPEKSLHLVGLLGGWPGATVARQTFRHKTQKLSFRLISVLILAFHLSLIWYGVMELLRD